MKKIALGILLGFGLFQVSAAEVKWQTDMAKAVEQAKTEKKLVLIDFTGSDW